MKSDSRVCIRIFVVAVFRMIYVIPALTGVHPGRLFPIVTNPWRFVGLRYSHYLPGQLGERALSRIPITEPEDILSRKSKRRDESIWACAYQLYDQDLAAIYGKMRIHVESMQHINALVRATIAFIADKTTKPRQCRSNPSELLYQTAQIRRKVRPTSALSHDLIH